jgi:hypothetical protein
VEKKIPGKSKIKKQNFSSNIAYKHLVLYVVMSSIKPLSQLTLVTSIENTKSEPFNRQKKKDYLKLSYKKLLPNLSTSQSKIKQI